MTALLKPEDTQPVWFKLNHYGRSPHHPFYYNALSNSSTGFAKADCKLKLSEPLISEFTMMCSSECPPHVPAFLWTVPKKVSKMAGVNVRADGDEEMLVELKGTWELLRQLPHALQELVYDWRLLFRITGQVSIPAEKFRVRCL